MLRRELLTVTGQALLLAACQKVVPTQPAAPSTKLAVSADALPQQFGLQLSTLNTLMVRDFEATLAQVAKIGYRQLEFSAMGLMGRERGEVKELLLANNLRAPVGRVSPKLESAFFQQGPRQMRQAFMQLSSPARLIENLKYSIQLAHFFEQKIINLPALMPATFADIGSVERNIELLNKAGDICAAEGLKFGYHNHNWEFAPIDDGTAEKRVPYLLMLERTDPDKVTFQLDSYWVAKAGVDWLSLMQSHPGRFASCHLKDIDAEGGMADVGGGEIDFVRFIETAKMVGAEHFFVERDNPPEPLASATRSFMNLHTLVQQERSL